MAQLIAFFVGSVNENITVGKLIVVMYTKEVYLAPHSHLTITRYAAVAESERRSK